MSIPIGSRKDDKFSRSQFAVSISKILMISKTDPSIVIGLEGSWGTGKTSCLNMIREYLNEVQDTIVVEYNPWLVSSLDSMVEGFFLELASAIGKSDKDQKYSSAIRRTLSFAKILTPIKLIPGAEPWASLVQKVIDSVGSSVEGISEFSSELSLLDKKRELSSELSKVAKHIVVIIDDLDRLPPEEIRLMIQMLKTICDFNGVSFLIAYDPKPVEEALSFDRLCDGHQYLQKIVQITYPIPRASKYHLLQYLASRVDSVLKLCGINRVESSMNRLNRSFAILLQLLTTPRKINNVCNQLRLTLEYTKNEVCFADIIVFHTLDIIYPKVTRLIRRNPEMFVSTNYSDDTEIPQYTGPTRAQRELYRNMGGRTAEKEKEEIEKLLELLDVKDSEAEILRDILVFLFPNLSGSGYIVSKEAMNQICNRDALLILVHSGPFELIFTIEMLNDFIHDETKRELIWSDITERNRLSNWMIYVSTSLNGVEIIDVVNLLDFFISKFQGPCEHGQLKEVPIYFPVSRFLFEHVLSVNNKKYCLEIMTHLVERESAVTLAQHVLVTLLKEAGLWDNFKYFPDKEGKVGVFTTTDLSSLTTSWITTTRNLANGDGIIETQIDPFRVLRRWGEFNTDNTAEAFEYIKKNWSKPKWLFKLLISAKPNEILLLIEKAEMEEFISNLKQVESISEEAKQAVKLYKDLIKVTYCIDL